MNLNDAADGIATNLATITKLNVHSEVPGKVTTPAAIVFVADGVYDTEWSDGCEATFTVLLLVSRADEKQSQRNLREYLSPTGSQSLKAAIESDDTLGGISQWVQVAGWGETQTVQVGELEYIGVEITVTAGG